MHLRGDLVRVTAEFETPKGILSITIQTDPGLMALTRGGTDYVYQMMARELIEAVHS